MASTPYMSEDRLFAAWHIVGISTAIIISQYDPSHSSEPMLCPSWSADKPWTASWQTCMGSKIYPRTLTSLVHDPSPETFIGAVSLFTLAVILAHKDSEKHQPHNSLLVGIVGAGLISVGRQYVVAKEPWTRSFQTSLPLGILAAIIVTSVFTLSRRLLPTKRGPTPDFAHPLEKGKGEA